MRDSMYDDTAARVALTPAVRITGTFNGPTVDLAGAGNNYRVAMLVVAVGVITDGAHAVRLQESGDGSAWADVAGEHRQGSVPPLGAAQSGSAHRVGYIGNRRYLRAVLEVTGATVGGLTAAVILMGSGSGAPVT